MTASSLVGDESFDFLHPSGAVRTVIRRSNTLLWIALIPHPGHHEWHCSRSLQFCADRRFTGCRTRLQSDNFSCPLRDAATSSPSMVILWLAQVPTRQTRPMAKTTNDQDEIGIRFFDY